jgi:hypothetical protein
MLSFQISSSSKNLLKMAESNQQTVAVGKYMMPQFSSHIGKLPISMSST